MNPKYVFESPNAPPMTATAPDARRFDRRAIARFIVILDFSNDQPGILLLHDAYELFQMSRSGRDPGLELNGTDQVQPVKSAR